MTKRLIKYIVTHNIKQLSIKHIRTDHLASFDSSNEALQYIQSQNTKSLEIIEIQYVSKQEAKQLTQYGIAFYYDLETENGSIESQELHPLSEFNKPKLVENYHKKIFLLRTVLNINEVDIYKKGMSIFNSNRTQLINQVAESYQNVLYKFIAINVIKIQINYDIPAITICFIGYNNLVIKPVCIINSSFHSIINKTYDEYIFNPCHDTIKLSYDAILTAVTKRNTY